jgi:hypothetical protein
MPDVHLEAHDGKTTFYLGEPIRLDLVFENHTGSPFALNNTDYGDMSEKVEISPQTGWIQWQTRSAHDYGTGLDLSSAPIRIPVQLDEGFVFREPGEYRVRVTTDRLTRGNRWSGDGDLPITTNELAIHVDEMPAGEEAARLREIRAALASSHGSDNRARQEALRSLACLQGVDALVEKIRLMEDGDDSFRAVFREAFATTHDLNRQFALLEQAWRDPKLIALYNTSEAIAETRLLLAGRNLSGFQMMVETRAPDVVEQKIAAEYQADMAALLDSMPARRGESRTMSAYFLIERGGLSGAQYARAVDYAVEEFPNMDNTDRDMLLTTANPPLRDVRLLPTLRSMLDSHPSNDVVKALLDVAPAETATWIVKSVCAPTGVMRLDTYKDVASDRVPEVDPCLSALLRTAPSEQEEIQWQQHAKLAARFATSAVLPALREGWKNSTQDGAVLAVLIRNEPAGAVELLKTRAAAGKFDEMLFFDTGDVYKHITQTFHEEVLTWLRAKVTNGSAQEVRAAAYALSIGGEASDHRTNGAEN